MISRRLLLAALCALSVAWPLACTAPRGAGDGGGRGAARPLRVMSYNIHIGQGLDKAFDLPRIARVINAQSPDLVAVQEVDVMAQRSGRIDQAEALGRLTGMHVYFGKAINHSGGAYGQAILSRFKLRRTMTHVLPGKAERETRVLLEVHVEAPGMPRLRFLGTHLDYLPDESDRLEQARWINDLLRSDPSVPTILAGDLNARPHSGAMQRFLELWTDTSGGGDEPTFPADKPDRRIDYVLTPRNQPWRVLGHRVIDEPLASDHRPVVVELQWTGQHK